MVEDFLIVIPARLGSSRLRHKPLQDVHGKPLLAWVIEACLRIHSKVLVATDSSKVARIAQEWGVPAVMTASSVPSGTDRVWQAVKDLNYEFIVNVQGDEPLVKEEHVVPLIERLSGGDEYATPAVAFSEAEEVKKPSTVKVVRDCEGYALYFSRSVIPYAGEPLEPRHYLKHIGIYAYRKKALERFVSLKPGRLERLEGLEQLRILENGFKIYVELVRTDTVSVDTPEDLERVRKLLGEEIRWRQN